MLENINAASVQLLTLISFAISVGAAVLAIDTYRLLRTGEVGHSWRILIIASVLFAFTFSLALGREFRLEWFRPFASFPRRRIIVCIRFGLCILYATPRLYAG